MAVSIQTRLPTEERQAAIVAAVLNLAIDASPAQITTAAIADAVGVTQGAVFKHFLTKEAIWLAAMKWVREQLLASLTQAAESQPSPMDALGAVFRAHVDFVVRHPGVPRFIFHELQQPSDSAAKQEVRGVLQAYRTLLLGILEQAERQHLLAPDLDREAAATLFVGIVQGLVMQALLSGEPASMHAQAERVFVLYLRGIGDAP